MSSSHRRLPQSWLPSRRRPSSPLFSGPRGTRLAPALRIAGASDRFSLRLAQRDRLSSCRLSAASGDTMKKPDAVSTDCNLDRRTVLKLGAGISAFAVASRGPVSAAVLANNNEIVALSARAPVDYVPQGGLTAQPQAHGPH